MRWDDLDRGAPPGPVGLRVRPGGAGVPVSGPLHTLLALAGQRGWRHSYRPEPVPGPLLDLLTAAGHPAPDRAADTLLLLRYGATGRRRR
ncbi:hypothetical protein [Kitasatospora purpeofusca]|uniref:hypothetical protein n=1 Tax=Kitasatospora purpeofusca TaxID=67352 RepID=UPI00380A738A